VYIDGDGKERTSEFKRGTTVYAVKFGTAQELGYVRDQAINVLTLLRNKAGVRFDHSEAEDRGVVADGGRSRHHARSEVESLSREYAQEEASHFEPCALMI
jgi:hypothetical protein